MILKENKNLHNGHARLPSHDALSQVFPNFKCFPPPHNQNESILLFKLCNGKYVGNIKKTTREKYLVVYTYCRYSG